MSTATIDRLLDSVLDASDAPLDVQQRARAQARELARRLGNQQGLRGHPAAKDAACVLLAMQVYANVSGCISTEHA